MSRAKKFFAKAAAERQAIEDAKPKSWEIKPWTTLDSLLVMALAQKFHPGKGFMEVMSGKPKKFLDVCYKLSGIVSQEVLATTVLPVMKAPMPFKMLDERIAVYTTLEAATEQFVEDRCHGMVIHNSIIYPVKIFAEDTEAHDWGMKNEATLRTMVAESTMAALGLDKIKCHVMLFAQWKFSGRMALVERSKNQPIKTAKSTVKVVG